jgi:hypothetical protein
MQAREYAQAMNPDTSEGELEMILNQSGASSAVLAAAAFLTLSVGLGLASHTSAYAEMRPPADGQDIRKIVIADGVYQFMTIETAT